MKDFSDCIRCRGGRLVGVPASTGSFMGHQFDIAAKSIPCPECSNAVITGKRISSRTGETSDRLVTMEVSAAPRVGETAGDLPWVLKITDGGVTGFEGVYLSDYFIANVQQKGWWACAGTPEVWDGLHIAADQMQKALKELQITRDTASDPLLSFEASNG